jgi:hypothetical protein
MKRIGRYEHICELFTKKMKNVYSTWFYCQAPIQLSAKKRETADFSAAVNYKPDHNLEYVVVRTWEAKKRTAPCK